MTKADLLQHLAARAAEAERVGYTAPVAAIYRDVIQQIEDVDGLESDARYATYETIARQMKVKVKWFSEHKRELPFIVTLCDGTPRVDVRKWKQWLAKR